MFLCPFLSPAKEKNEKKRRLSGRGAAKLGKLFANLNLKHRRVFCNPLPLKNPPLFVWISPLQMGLLYRMTCNTIAGG